MYNHSIGLIEISGMDAKKFLQGQLTCNVNTIAGDHGQLGAHCNQQGRVVSLFWITEKTGKIYLCMPRDMIPTSITALNKYAIFFKVMMTDVSEIFTSIGFVDVKSDFSCSDSALICIKIPTASHRYLLMGDPSGLHNQLETLGNQIQISTIHTWKAQDIEDGIPMLHPETSGVFLPHELNLDTLNAISFDKGCYTGQEIIARMHYKGKLKSRMYRAKINSTTPILPGSDIYTPDSTPPRAVGKVVDACQDDNNWYNVLMTLEESSLGNNRLFPSNNNQTYFTFG